MTHPLTPREKVEKAVERAVLRACNRTSGVKDVRLSSLICGEEIDQATDAILTALASGSGDHAELARLAEAATPGPWHSAGGYLTVRDPDGRSFSSTIYHLDEMGQRRPTQPFQAVPFARAADAAFIAAANPATILALLAENAALRGERDQIAGESIWWKGVIGDGPYRPSGEVRSIKHLHPAMVKPIYEANKGTAVADVIAGLIFLLAINQNREQFLVADANERLTEAERKLAEAVGLLEEILPPVLCGESWGLPDDDVSHQRMSFGWIKKVRTFLSKEAERVPPAPGAEDE